MADVKNLDFALVFANVIVDKIGAVQKFADLRSLSNQTADARKTHEQLDVLDQRTAKVSGSVRIIFSNVAEDFSEIV